MTAFHDVPMTIGLLILVAILTSTVLEFAAGMASVGWDSGYPKSVGRAMNVATLVWIGTCIVAILLLVRVIRIRPDDADDGSSSNIDAISKLRFTAIAMITAAVLHMAAYLSFLCVLGTTPKTKPLGWLLLFAPGILWILAGQLTLKEWPAQSSAPEEASYSHLFNQALQEERV